jgi:predicted CopG family antitoxin
MMPLISVVDECYFELEEIKSGLIKQKKAKGQPTKTTFSEVVCMLIRGRKEIKA